MSGTCIQTRSGKMVDPTNLSYSDINITDITCSLSLLCRFTGHCIMPYSVLQHSLLVYDIAKELNADHHTLLWALLHDAHEAYIGDIARPIAHIFKDTLEQIKDRIDKAIISWIWHTYKVPLNPNFNLVKRADEIALALERRHLMIAGAEWPGLTPVPYTEIDVVNLTRTHLNTTQVGGGSSVVRSMFTRRFRLLMDACVES